MTADPVLEVAPLGTPWPTIDPFLFCVHHLDRYPAANAQMGPDASLVGRDLGQDFAGIDGWRMYHGRTVPGFPQHPHRGFETVTYVRRGLIDHSDSMGAAARFGRGDVQWMTAGEGVVHSEMFPLLDRDGPNPVELFQIWVNLPSVDKLVVPHFTMLWDERIPRLVPPGGGEEVTVVAGALGGLVPASPPPHSWAADADHDVAIWHVTLAAGASWTMPPAQSSATVRTLYVFAGSSLRIGDREVESGHGAVVRSDLALYLGTGAGAEVLVLQGRPIGEPVARYGPFVMNERAEIQQAIEDYQRTGFGGWSWPSDDPVHGPDRGRFARHVDGSVEEPLAR
jgi:redox-sensitive bicupin YhaK (pirin superfamily)